MNPKVKQHLSKPLGGITQHSALPSGIYLHCATTMHAIRTYGTHYKSTSVGMYHKLSTLSSPHRRLLLPFGIYHWLLVPTLSAYPMCFEATLLCCYTSWLSNCGAHTKLKCRGLPLPLLQQHLLMLTPADIKPKLSTSATRALTPAIATPTTKPSTPT